MVSRWFSSDPDHGKGVLMNYDERYHFSPPRRVNWVNVILATSFVAGVVFAAFVG